MSREIDTQSYLNTVCALLEEGKRTVPVPVAGVSMVPFLFPGDTVFLDRPQTPLCRGDVVLFTRADGQYVLHRIAAVYPDGSFEMLGDGQVQREWVPDAGRIRARVSLAQHKGKTMRPGGLRWWFFARAWQWAEPLRPRLLAIYRRLYAQRFQTRTEGDNQ